MSLTNPYCTVAQVQAEIRNDQATLVTQIGEAINQASRFIDDWLRRDFYQHDHTTDPLVIRQWDERVFGRQLFLPFRPIIELTQVRAGTDVLAEGQDFIVTEDRLIRIGQAWATGEDLEIELTGKFGHAQVTEADVPAGLPPHINRAAILISAAFTGHNRKQVVGLDGNKEEVIDKAIPKTALDLLGYRRTVIV